MKQKVRRDDDRQQRPYDHGRQFNGAATCSATTIGRQSENSEAGCNSWSESRFIMFSSHSVQRVS